MKHYTKKPNKQSKNKSNYPTDIQLYNQKIEGSDGIYSKRYVNTNFNRFYYIVTKHLKASFRDRTGLFMNLAFPVFLMVLFSFALNFDINREKYQIVIINLDNIDENGALISAIDERTNASFNLLNLFDSENPNNEFSETFMLYQTWDNGSIITQNDALWLIEENYYEALIIIPQNFSENIAANKWWNNLLQNTNTSEIAEYENITDWLDDQFEQLEAIGIIIGDDTKELIYNSLEEEEVEDIEAYLNGSAEIPNGVPELNITTSDDLVASTVILSAFQGIINDMVLETNDVSAPEMQINTTSFFDWEFSIFDYTTPIFLTVGILVSIGAISATLSQERTTKVIKRLDTTPVPRYIQILGMSTGQVIIGLVQILLLLVSVPLLGTKIHPEANWILAYFVTFSLQFTGIGIGIFIGSIVKNESATTLITTIIITTFQLLGNSYFPINEFIEKLIPSYYTVDGLKKILLFGMGFEFVIIDIFIPLLYGIILMLFGTLIFSKKRKI
ncbi:MAG: ABC transporter permease [archaeon]|nr:ABC transporter permease [archaeon]